MSEYKSEFLKTLSDRGFIKQVTHPAEMDAYCQTGIPTAYIGYDATADSLHVGHLMQIMMGDALLGEVQRERTQG